MWGAPELGWSITSVVTFAGTVTVTVVTLRGVATEATR